MNKRTIGRGAVVLITGFMAGSILKGLPSAHADLVFIKEYSAVMLFEPPEVSFECHKILRLPETDNVTLEIIEVPGLPLPPQPQKGIVPTLKYAAEVMSYETFKAKMTEEDIAAFTFHEQEIHWRDHVLVLDEIEETRSFFAISFGSCSFDEPHADLKKIGLI